jgi:hypothetical protein
MNNSNWYRWWFKTDAGLAARIAIGVSIFAVLGGIDLVRNGRAAQRWREYAFLLCATLAGIIYGVANDAITSSISWEYFFYGKGLDQVMPAQLPPDRAALCRAAMGIGCKAGGSAGILIGAVLLIANNPRSARRRLTYPELASILAAIYPVTILCSSLFGMAGAMGWLLWTSRDLAELWRAGDYRPARFLGVYGIHLGAYLGGVIGTAIALPRIEQRRRASLSR